MNRIDNMNRKPLSALLILCALALATAVHSVSVGTAPGVLDVGEVKPGKDYTFTFYLTTNSKTDLLVSIAYIKIHADIYNQEQRGRYTFIPSEASQEEIEKWIDIPRSTQLLSPANVKVINMENGGVVRAYGTVDVILHIPANAEPGYHAGAINLSPQVPTAGGGGTGVVTFGVTRFVFVFRVAGTAIRKGDIMTLYGTRMGGDKAKVTAIFKNTGTCTLEAWVESLRLFDKFGNLTAELQTANREFVKPGQIVELGAYWSGENVKPGTYRAEARVGYLTGYATMDSKIEIPATIKVEPAPVIPIAAGGIPWLPILLIIIILILIWYYMKEEK